MKEASLIEVFDSYGHTIFAIYDKQEHRAVLLGYYDKRRETKFGAQYDLVQKAKHLGYHIEFGQRQLL